MSVNWADELGIDLDELRNEHPMSRKQLLLRREHEARADAHWALVNGRDARLAKEKDFIELDKRAFNRFVKSL